MKTSVKLRRCLAGSLAGVALLGSLALGGGSSTAAVTFPTFPTYFRGLQVVYNSQGQVIGIQEAFDNATSPGHLDGLALLVDPVTGNFTYGVIFINGQVIALTQAQLDVLSGSQPTTTTTTSTTLPATTTTSTTTTLPATTTTSSTTTTLPATTTTSTTLSATTTTTEATTTTIAETTTTAAANAAGSKEAAFPPGPTYLRGLSLVINAQGKVIGVLEAFDNATSPGNLDGLALLVDPVTGNFTFGVVFKNGQTIGLTQAQLDQLNGVATTTTTTTVVATTTTTTIPATTTTTTTVT